MKKRLRLLLLLLLFLVMGCPMEPTQPVQPPQKDIYLEVNNLPPKANRYALVIGIDQYESTLINPLRGGANDAKTLADALVTYAGFPQENVSVLLSHEQIGQLSKNADSKTIPTRGNILSYLAKIRNKLSQNALLLVAFSGHGMEKNGKVYMLPVDTQTLDTSLLEDTAIDVDLIKKRILDTGVKQVLFIVDACRNDPEPSKATGDNTQTDTYVQKFSFDRANEKIEAFATLFATSSGQRAYEDDEKHQGYFTYALVEGLKGKAANPQGQITLANLINYIETTVPQRVQDRLHKKQVPKSIISGYQSNALVLALIPSPTDSPESNLEKVQTNQNSSATDLKTKLIGKWQRGDKVVIEFTNEGYILVPWAFDPAYKVIDSEHIEQTVISGQIVPTTVTIIGDKLTLVEKYPNNIEVKAELKRYIP